MANVEPQQLSSRIIAIITSLLSILLSASSFSAVSSCSTASFHQPIKFVQDELGQKNIMVTCKAPSIVYTIAGSDSGGGAGIQADLKAIHTLSSGSCHGCSAITCLTAQNSMGVTKVHSPGIEFLREQLTCLEGDLYPSAIKVGMLGTGELAEEVGDWLRRLKETSRGGKNPLVVVDPVMISTSGHKLIDDDAKAKMIQKVFPNTDLVTPNKFEAEELLGRRLLTPDDIETGAREILRMGPKAVLIKGGHSFVEEQGKVGDGDFDGGNHVDVSEGFAQDYLLMSREFAEEGKPVKDRPRLCDGSRGVWICNDRYETIHTHGTGCTLSSAIATAWSMGQSERDDFSSGGKGEKVGALGSMYLVDACCIAKAYVNAGIARGVQLGKGPGPVVHTGFPSSHQHFPTVAFNAYSASPRSFLAMQSYRRAQTSQSEAVTLGRILPIVETVEWIEKLASTSGVEDIQLRIKDTSDYATVLDRIKSAQSICQRSGVRLWINDHWKAAIEAGGCFGIHLGQEDLASCVDFGGLDEIRAAGLAFGVSTHSYSELAVALGVRPSYISLGPVFPTSSKDVKFYPQGLETVRQWKSLIPPEIPLVAIGGIGDANVAKVVRGAGADCAAVIGAVTKVDDVAAAVTNLNEAMC
eukprot:CAMPEP_0171337412 /NCGR_PEP_ID=MMETSP0878-20121228/6672_1 /TAXON_ID=67004 /ORGANISM="Thalassiosira weissflogii, Strain CCMP1336" /LENGTH=638 /DNA_ID=CAMNT_0011839031 /DNA_START=1 /DNA_END=1917 /DNA_ORIENTATION=-